jgi:hypothetical protein
MSTRPSVLLKSKRASLFIGLVMLAATLLCFVQTRRTLACPVAVAVPLRPLYMASQRVVVARAGHSVLLQTEKIGEEEDYERTLLRTSFYVSKTLKGEGAEEQVVHVYQWLWGKDQTVPENYAEGKTLLLFLIKSEEGEGYEVGNDTYGAKKLSDDDLKVYVERIEELAKILRAKQPDKAEIVEWLVRCAEEHATRWEGAYELSTSQDFLNGETEAQEDKTGEGEETAEAEASSGAAPASDEPRAQTEEITASSIVMSQGDSAEMSPYSGEIARLINADQKKRLANVFFGLQTLTDEDIVLLNLVQNYEDERLIPFILSHLEKAKDEPPAYAEQLVATLAAKLQNEKLSAIAENYCSKARYYDSTEAEERGDADDEEKNIDEEEKSLTGNSAQKRRARLQRFLAEAQNVINTRIAMSQ